MSPVADNISPAVVAYKGFNRQMQCLGYQFEVGETYTHKGEVTVCQSGFHACENPLDVFSYYPPGTSVYAEVEASGEISRREGDTKLASRKLHVKAALIIGEIVSRAVAWAIAHGNPTASHTSGYRAAASATGNGSAASATGNDSAASATGDRSAASATGDGSAASATGDGSTASATGYASAASGRGPCSAASATGNDSAASATGHGSASLVTGLSARAEIKASEDGTPLHAVAIATGYQGQARASSGSAIVLVERTTDGDILHVRASKVGENGIKPDVWYTLTDGEFTEVA
jgi:hypothetical protein